jgi:hypothetical protein
MAATTPVVLWASRLFHRWCEEPCIEIAKQVGRVAAPRGTASERLLTSR